MVDGFQASVGCMEYLCGMLNFFGNKNSRCWDMEKMDDDALETWIGTVIALALWPKDHLWLAKPDIEIHSRTTYLVIHARI